jgi:hypothetical protein
MLLWAIGHPDFFQFDKSRAVLRGPAGGVLGTHPGQNLIDAPVKLKIAGICPSAAEPQYDIIEVLSGTLEICVHFATG